MLDRLKENIKIFNTPLEISPEEEKIKSENTRIFYLAITVVFVFLSVVNYKTSRIMFLTTSLAAAICFAGFIVGLTRKKLMYTRICTSTALILLFSVWIVIGGNDGFAVIWLAILPALAMLAHGLRHGTLFSLYFAIFLPIMFYSPLNRFLMYDYNPIFRQRFPIVYFVSFICSFLGLFLKHKTALINERQKKEMEELRRSADEANRAKSLFLAAMSHEIRTPINGIIGMDTILLSECKDEHLREYALNIQSAGNTLLSLINDILDISKIESGKMEILPLEYEMYSVLNDCYNVTNPRAKDKGLSFVMDIDENLPARYFGDEVRVRQIITNLLSNAVKYTDAGKLELKVTGERSGEFELLTISVSDTGMGIKEEDLGRLFDNFTRLDESRNRNIQGTGLGLSLVKNLLTLMNGTISVESTYGSGSVFTVNIPQKVVGDMCLGDFADRYHRNEVTPENIPEIIAPDAKILVVDDVDMNLKVVKGLLKKSQITIDTALDGNECIEKMEQTEYDVVLLDHMMPGMDGIETLKNFRSKERPHNMETPVIMLTANAVSGAREEYMDAGFTDYLTKPIIKAKLVEMLKKYLN